MRTLLTGFGAFGTVSDNPSARIVEHFEREGTAGHELTTRILPVSFMRASAEIRGLLLNSRFDTALMLGVAADSLNIRLERFAHNKTNARIPDIDGERPRHVEIIGGGHKTYRTPFDLKPLLSALTASGIPARISHSPGRYVCNHLYYTALHTVAESDLSTRCLFVHVPEEVNIPRESQLQAIRQILGLLAR